MAVLSNNGNNTSNAHPLQHLKLSSGQEVLFSNLPELNAKLPATHKGLFDDLGTKEAKEGLEDAKGD
ncbi:hypothetical protein [Helicobacter ailurogastricus]|uniref:hypothetical protein n=1 Tax=Helicobacter ailurogastricus TaxID=1578720 RepID=UPI00244D98AF|nr:hypothetical protein [Helicobacter ailurogastricus]GMB92135.1 hypothetical protein NHP190009_13160 [Helicobacter ailurogastricus]